MRNVLNNLQEPITFANDLFQGKGDQAGQSLARFMINTSLGGLGLFDPATTFGHPRHDNDFGLTLAHYGTGPGPVSRSADLRSLERARRRGLWESTAS